MPDRWPSTVMSLLTQSEWATGWLHLAPVILICSAACQTDLIVPAVVVESGPGKTVGTASSKDPLEKAHFVHSSVGEPALPPRDEVGTRRFEYRPDSMFSEAYFRP